MVASMTDHDDDDDLGAGNLFADPEGFYPEDEQPTFSSHQMLSGQTIRVRLVGSHPLYVCDFPLHFKHNETDCLSWRVTCSGTPAG